jgi:glycosyltransferase involved in cell wall biosynthesis
MNLPIFFVVWILVTTVSGSSTKDGPVMNEANRRIRIAYLTMRDPKDRRTWSGTYYYMAQALQKHCGEVFYVGPIDASKQKLVGRIFNRGSRLFFRKGFMYHHCFLVARQYARVASQRLRERSFDVIIAPVGATLTAFLKTGIPIVLVEDATYALLHNYYPEYSNLVKRSVYEMNTLEDSALKKASAVISSSEWAAQSVVEFYHTNRKKVYVVPLGANFEDVPRREIVLKRKRSDQCKLLFIGVSWQRKGGDIAFETLLKLEEMGIRAELTVCGCTPPSAFSHERMTIIPFLDKNNEGQRRELENLFLTSDFLLLPTRNDCTPIVFCEANSFGLPVITTNTGGVPGVIIDGENGFMLPLDARGAEYARVIARVYKDDKRYAELVASSRAAFDDRLNWDAWGSTMKNIISTLLD